MTVFWYFMIYISPVLLVVVCAYLAWEAFRETQKADAESGTAERQDEEDAEDRLESDDWRTDPDSWRDG